MKEWLKMIKEDAKERTDSELMRGIDLLDERVAKSKAESKAIELMKAVYWNELQERLWSY